MKGKFAFDIFSITSCLISLIILIVAPRSDINFGRNFVAEISTLSANIWCYCMEYME